MTKLKQLLKRLHDDEQGSGTLSSMFIAIVLSLVVIIGLVVDGAGKYQTAAQAQQIAASAARAATNAISGDTVIVGALSLDAEKASQAATAYINAAGMTGTVTVAGTVVTVEVSTSYTTRFLSLIGVTSLPASAEASAELITQ